jgi:hypothetical protein
MPNPSYESQALDTDAALATTLKKWWPHREHESNSLKAFSCYFGVHRWRELKIHRFLPSDKEVRFCHWCSRIRIDGVIYEP